jgi:hypothetical protein
VSLFGLAGGSLRATGGKYAAGIGSGPGSLCNSVRVENGSYDARGGQYGSGISLATRRFEREHRR